MIPGWDVHGLPIEIKAIQELGQSMVSDKKDQSAMAIRKKASEVAKRYIKLQREQFMSLGIIGDWDSFYSTKGMALDLIYIDPSYEARVLRVLKKFLERGFLKRTLKPVYWSPSSQTALAESELEYDDNYKSTALYFSYPLFGEKQECQSQLRDKNGSFPLLLVWTTTPWTIPSNMVIIICFYASIGPRS